MGLVGWLVKRFFSSSRTNGNISLRGSSVKGSAIASGSNIQQTVQFYGHSASTERSGAEFRSDPTPREIFEKINAAPPYQRETVENSYGGLAVRWRLFLISISQGKVGDLYDLHLEPSDEFGGVFCEVSISDYPRLKISRRYAPLEVTGFIQKASRMTIELEKAQITFLDVEAQVKDYQGLATRAEIESPKQRRDRTSEITEISFGYLPASLLDNGWKPADSQVTPSLTCSSSSERPGGLTREAESSDALDFALEKHQRVSNHLRFEAKLFDGAHVYARIQLIAKDGRPSKAGWIACDVGNKPLGKRPGNEWVIYRLPQNTGWTLFDLSLPHEVRETFGKDEGFEFGELLSLRLRGSLSVSPITLSLEKYSIRKGFDVQTKATSRSK